MGTFFPSAFIERVSCSSFSEIRPGVEAEIVGEWLRRPDREPTSKDLSRGWRQALAVLQVYILQPAIPLPSSGNRRFSPFRRRAFDYTSGMNWAPFRRPRRFPIATSTPRGRPLPRHRRHCGRRRSFDPLGEPPARLEQPRPGDADRDERPARRGELLLVGRLAAQEVELAHPRGDRLAGSRGTAAPRRGGSAWAGPSSARTGRRTPYRPSGCRTSPRSARRGRSARSAPAPARAARASAGRGTPGTAASGTSRPRPSPSARWCSASRMPLALLEARRVGRPVEHRPAVGPLLEVAQRTG